MPDRQGLNIADSYGYFNADRTSVPTRAPVLRERSGSTGSAGLIHLSFDRASRYLGYTDRVSKVLVSFEDALLRRIDRAASSRGMTRSAYLAQLAESDAGREFGPGQTPPARAALRELDRLFADAPGGESTAAIRDVRDAR